MLLIHCVLLDVVLKQKERCIKNIAISHCISLVINRKLLSAPEVISVGFHVSMIFSERQHLNIENVWGHRLWKSFT